VIRGKHERAWLRELVARPLENRLDDDPYASFSYFIVLDLPTSSELSKHRDQVLRSLFPVSPFRETRSFLVKRAEY